MIKAEVIPCFVASSYHGAVKRVWTKTMTAAVIVPGLPPILWSHGAAADVMKRIATLMIGGIITSTAMELIAFPAIFFFWRSRRIAQKRIGPVAETQLV